MLDLISEDLGVGRPGGRGGVFRPEDLADALTEVQDSISALTLGQIRPQGQAEEVDTSSDVEME